MSACSNSNVINLNITIQKCTGKRYISCKMIKNNMYSPSHIWHYLLAVATKSDIVSILLLKPNNGDNSDMDKQIIITEPNTRRTCVQTRSSISTSKYIKKTTNLIDTSDHNISQKHLIYSDEESTAVKESAEV